MRVSAVFMKRYYFCRLTGPLNELLRIRFDEHYSHPIAKIAAALCFLFRPLPFVLQTTAHGGSSGTSRLSRPRRFGRIEKHPAQFFQTVGSIAAGIAESLAGYQQVSLGSDSPGVPGRQPLPHGLGQTGAFRHRPTEHRLGVQLIDVLPPRPAAAAIAELKLAKRNLNFRRYDEHGGE